MFSIASVVGHPEFLQWTIIVAATVLGLALLAYDLQNKKVETSEKCNVKLKIEAVSMDQMRWTMH